jgi:RimJ/RimL family protein N-acetyltransferase
MTEISPGEHHAWFSQKLENPDCALLIIEEDAQPVGQVRFDRIGPDLAEISIGLAPEARGRGIGKAALRMAASDAFHLLGVSGVKALVKRDNAASLAAFIAAGFRVVGEDGTAVMLLHGPDRDSLAR